MRVVVKVNLIQIFTIKASDFSVAEVRKQESALGAYIDILSDFTIYGWIPISLTFEASWANQNDIYSLWLTLAILESLYFVNSASLFYLAAILEQRQAGKLKTKEMTHVTMCEALIGGTETILFYSLMIILPRFYLPFLFLLFALLVFFSILQRLWWAVRML
ncbi:CDP-alcohol phosphatidyltransferase [Galdieria sulphuraria]|uniref:CDP-alcohol phosphatidyltransferase n=1 Tax=Galdieria sulphuraria TaxID=130081 RepID=M2WUC1_GALSU|nr:CDP-alcohol phosphatidyltransferase [Galdieria sulphuraria]EME27525.1 CDP-alcohol phosphatidyltransferase [Galdieria sulphuraria]|eukprot:XP_005704045.1 CDP-alcohol phosphatidyltransferase [Galdieria sulphuraria]